MEAVEAVEDAGDVEVEQDASIKGGAPKPTTTTAAQDYF